MNARSSRAHSLLILTLTQMTGDVEVRDTPPVRAVVCVWVPPLCGSARPDWWGNWIGWWTCWGVLS